jgi:hypothetical protein
VRGVDGVVCGVGVRGGCVGWVWVWVGWVWCGWCGGWGGCGVGGVVDGVGVVWVGGVGVVWVCAVGGVGVVWWCDVCGGLGCGGVGGGGGSPCVRTFQGLHSALCDFGHLQFYFCQFATILN